MSELPAERRRFKRIAFDARTELGQGPFIWPVKLIDLSLKGLLIERPEPWLGDPQKDFFVHIHLSEGVDIDMCPTCKGVWLDRGELDKLLVQEREDSEKQIQAQKRFHEEVNQFGRDPDKWRNEHRYDDEKKRYRYDGDDDDRGDSRRKRRGGFDLFDIFD